MTDINTKAELDADIEAKFPDNTQGLISAQRLREYLKSVNRSLMVQRTEVVELTGDPYVVPAAEVTENVLHVNSGQDRIIQLPAAASLTDQSFVLLTVDNFLVNIQSADPITGDANFSEPCLIQLRSNGAEWFSIPVYLSRKDTIEYNIVFNEPGTLSNGEETRLGNTELQQNEGWVAPRDGSLTRISISRQNSASATIDIEVNGVTQATVSTTGLKDVQDLDVALSEGDGVKVLGGSASPNNSLFPVIVLVFTRA